MGWILEGIPGKFEQITSDNGLEPEMVVRTWRILMAGVSHNGRTTELIR